MSEFSSMEEYGWLSALVARHYDLRIEGKPILLNQQGERQVFRLNTASETLILRLCPSSRSYDQVVADTQLLLYLSQKAFPAPTLRLTTLGKPVFSWQAKGWAYVVTFVEGEHLQWNLAALQDVAALVGRLHSLPTVPHLGQVDWLDETNLTINALESSINDPKWGVRAMEVIGSMRDMPRLRGLPSGLVHIDVHEGNLLYTPRGQLCLIDWEGAGIGEFIIDLAIILGWHCLWPQYTDTKEQPSVIFDFNEQWCKTFLAAYQKIRPLTYEEAQHLGPAIRFLLGWYTARDIAKEIQEEGSSEGLAFFHWMIIHNLTPVKEKMLTQWAIETGATP